MPRRGRRSAEDATQSQVSDLGNGLTRAAYRCTLWGLIPGVGLVLGPAGMLLAVVGFIRERLGPPRKGRSPALAVLGLSSLVGATNWAGALLMIYGWTSASS
jgi:hypothetical protein